LTRENVEIVRAALEAFEQGDLDGALEFAHPDLVSSRLHPDGSVFHGRDGFRRLLAEWLEDFSEWSFSNEEYIDAGDRVVVKQRQWGRGVVSGAPVEADWWMVYTLAEGRITHLDIYASEAEALEATTTGGSVRARPGRRSP
jgi:ketosteroid isomerase-like protein